MSNVMNENETEDTSNIMQMFDENWFFTEVCRQAFEFLAEVKEQKIDEVTLGFKAFEMFGAFLNRDIMLDSVELFQFYANALERNRLQRLKIDECVIADSVRLHENNYGTGKIAPSFER